MKFLAIVGTNSDRSTNRKLLQFMQKHFKTQADIEVQEIKDLPAFDEPEDHHIPAAVQAFSDKIAAADGIIIATPEYDHSIPAVLKSALEWLSYTTRPLIDKPVMIVGSSLGSLGTSRAQAHLRQILDAPELKARVMPGTEFLLGHSAQVLDENNDLLDTAKVKELEESFAEFCDFVPLVNELVQKYPNRTAANKSFSWEVENQGGQAK